MKESERDTGWRLRGRPPGLAEVREIGIGGTDLEAGIGIAIGTEKDDQEGIRERMIIIFLTWIVHK